MASKLYSRGFCAFCKLPATSRRLPLQPPRKKLHTESTSSQFQDDPPPKTRKLDRKELAEIEGDGPILSQEDTDHQLRLNSHVDLIRESLLNDTSVRVWKNDVSVGILGPILYPGRIDRLEDHERLPEPSFPMGGEPLPHDTFRRELAARTTYGPKAIRRIMREQLLRCQWPREILRVLAVAMQRKETAREMAYMSHSILRAIYRSRNNVTDARILSTITVIVVRLTKAKLQVHPDLLSIGLKFAARSRSLPGMKRYLKEIRERNVRLTRSVFRTVIAKFSVGTGGLGEIRNGRWRRQELLQVLLGFEDSVPGQEYHLGSFLVRDDWQYFHGWLTVLSRCKAVDELWAEWLYWLQSPARTNPKRLQTTREMTTKTRGDLWFVEQMCFAGDVRRAWEILHISGIPFQSLRLVARSILLENPEFAKHWDDHMTVSMLEKYVVELEKLEKALGARWVRTEDGEGHHVLEQDLEERLGKLGDPNLLTTPLPGYPWDSEATDMQRELNEAEEVH